MISDTHLHSAFSCDSNTPPRENAESAESQNIKTIAFTEHYDCYLGGRPTDDFDGDAYFKEILALKDEFAGRVGILTGIEIGMQPPAVILEQSAKRIEGLTLDHVVGSMHYVSGLDVYDGSYFNGKDKRESYTLLLRETLECLKKYTFVDTLGHIDYSSRYAPYEDRQLRYREFPDEFDELFRYIIENGLSLEFNTKTAGRVPPDPDVWTRYKELGGELVTFASDAHKPWLVGYEFEKHTAFLKNLGYKYAFRYENRKPVAEEL